MRRCHRQWLALLAATLASRDTADAFVCPSPTKAPVLHTLSMNCFGACPGAGSPCLFHSGAAKCSGLESQPQQFGTSTCVVGDNAQCALECLSPISGAARDEWNLVLTDAGAGFAEDVAERQQRDPAFRFVTRPVEWVRKITDLTFAPTTTLVSISGEALPVRDKVNAYTVVEKGSVVFVELQTVDIFRNARNLTTIMIENVDLNGLSTFPTGLARLETLILSNNRLEAIPNGIASLSNLTTLDLSQNIFKKIAADELPKNLVELNLQACSLVELPSVILQMPRLKKLDLGGNMFASPAAASLPLQLESLELGLNEFRDADLRGLPRSLEILYVYGSQLQALPDDLPSLTNLLHFDASENEITELKPHALPPKLRFLNVSTNLLATLPADTLPPTLEMLDVSLNKLKTLPDDVVQLQALKALYLNGNAFSVFPEQVFKLAALERRTSPAVYVLVAVGALCVVAAAVGIVVWRRRRIAASKPEVWSQPGGGDRGRGSVSDKRMFIVDDMENDLILESPARRNDMATGVGDYVTTRSAKLSSRTSSGSSKGGSRRFLSVWDDEELLRWRVDATQIHDVELLGAGFFGDVWLARYLGGLVAACLLSRVASGEIQPMFTQNAPADVVALARQCFALDPAARPSAVQVAYQLRQLAAASGYDWWSTDSSQSTASPSTASSVACTSNSVGIL
ncbi:hypothetical protein PybrP1_006667 [[Pythium] brassicae (nom. inval.)]|nr:hypothetical protein PybrP1_006667 [[Pythium] brassicae (nom. inval.)]